MNAAKLMWQRRFDISTVIGALDCIHIVIQKPSQFGDEYINRKGQYTCGRHLLWSNSLASSLSDQGAFMTQEYGEVQLEASYHGMMVKYVVRRLLIRYITFITPYKPRRNQQETRLDIIHSRGRVIIEIHWAVKEEVSDF